MKNKLLSIGQMAKMNHTTVPTLRLYDQLGAAASPYTDPETSYRYYDIRQNARFDLIQYMKELGMSLEEIQRVLKKEDLQLVENILIKKREQVFAQIRQSAHSAGRDHPGHRQYRALPQIPHGGRDLAGIH